MGPSGVLAREDVEWVDLPMCAFGLGPPDEPSTSTGRRWFFQHMLHYATRCNVGALELDPVIGMYH